MTAILFDIDGTLTDTKKVDDACFIQAFETVFGIDISRQNWSELKNVTDWGITEEIIVRERNSLPTGLEYERLTQEFVRLLQEELQADKTQFQEITGAFDFIQFLKQKAEVAIGIATGGWEPSALLKLQAIGIDASEFAFSSSTRFKERTDIVSDTIQQLQAKLGAMPKRIIYFGDGVWDFLTCQQLGIEFVGIDSQECYILQNLGAKTVSKDFTQPGVLYEKLGIKSSSLQ